MTRYIVLFLAGLFGFPFIASMYAKELAPPLTGLFVWMFLLAAFVGFSFLAKRCSLRNVLGVFSFVSAIVCFLLFAFIPLQTSEIPWSAHIFCGGLGFFTGLLAPLIVLELYKIVGVDS